MTSAEYAYWRELAALEPIGAERGDWQAAQITAAIYNVNRDTKAHPKPIATRDLLMFAPRQPMTDDEIEDALLAAFPQE